MADDLKFLEEFHPEQEISITFKADSDAMVSVTINNFVPPGFDKLVPGRFAPTGGQQLDPVLAMDIVYSLADIITLSNTIPKSVSLGLDQLNRMLRTTYNEAIDDLKRSGHVEGKMPYFEMDLWDKDPDPDE